MGAFWRMARVTIKTTALWTPVYLTFEECVYGHTTVCGMSMQPTLNPGDTGGTDTVVVEKMSVRLYNYTRGDVVLLRCVMHSISISERVPVIKALNSAWCHLWYGRSPNDPKMMLVKRLLALEGDWIAVSGRQGVEKIPQVRQKESYTWQSCIWQRKFISDLFPSREIHFHAGSLLGGG